MSRRHAPRTLEEAIEIHDYLESSWWTDEIPGYPGHTWNDWQNAFAEVTINVVTAVWRRTGAKLYAVQRDTLLRDDLQSWLMVRALEVAQNFTPDPWHAAPERQWGAYLRNALEMSAHWHFQDAVGRRTEDQAAWQAGIDSTERLDELEAEGARVERRVLHGHDMLTLDPLIVITRLEDLEEQTVKVTSWLASQGTYTTASDTCTEPGCIKPPFRRGLCQSHYNKERNLWGNASGKTCLEEECAVPAAAAGRCWNHYQANRRKQVAAGTWKPTRPAEGCSEPGCPKPHHSKGRCSMHYRAWRKEQSA